MYIPIESNDPIAKRINQKHREYLSNAYWACILYWATRICAGLSAAALPFIVNSTAPTYVITILSAIIVLCTFIDTIASPKDRWTLYAKATDLLSVANAMADGQYEKYQKQLNTLLETENESLKKIMNLGEMVTQINAAHKNPS